ncbi:N-acetylglucosamine kinase [Microbacterium sp. 1.5R]|uniref:N-acetylglucosamine kinase n=1 Tax=Microbacterium sp. 1.5R TaxID=1916917 RepID=UPI0011A76480|nr:BadF/BadG/BcrA/BcrD ATPase family protein [Microbacterium sp. 1.5R]
MSGTLAVDIGQTGLRLRLDGGDVIGAPIGVTALTDGDQVRALAQRIVDRMPAGARLERIGVGLSGFVEGSDAPAALAARLQGSLGAHSVVVAADAVTAFLGTVGARPGTVAICGTGVAALGIGVDAAPRRIDARGYLLGDFGSGFWIGQKGLQAALDAQEGRGEPTSLADRSGRLGSASDIYLQAMASTPPPKFVAEFAPDVLEAATDGDSVALDIVRAAAAELARTIRAARISAGPVGLTGGLVRASLFVDEVRAALDRADVPTDGFLVRADAALDGAGVIAEDVSIRSAFAGLIAVKE